MLAVQGHALQRLLYMCVCGSVLRETVREAVGSRKPDNDAMFTVFQDGPLESSPVSFFCVVVVVRFSTDRVNFN